MSDESSLAALCEEVLRRDHPDVEITLVEVRKDWERSRVARIRLEAGPAPTLIAKQIRAHPHLGFSDYASHEFLSSFDAPLVPRFAGGDSEHALFLMEDLGEFRNLMNVLPQGDEDVIHHTLTRLGATMGELVAATAGQERSWNACRSGLPAAPGPNRFDEARDWRDGWSKVARWLEQIDVAAPTGIGRMLDDISENHRAPRQLAFSQGDPAPTNHTLIGEHCHLVDFEYGAYRHALHDLAQWQIRCPLKPAWLEALSQPLRERLIGSMFRDDDEFERELLLQAAYAAIYMFMWIPVARALEEDFQRVGSWTQRDALICTCRRLSLIGSKLSVLEPARLLADAILDRLSSLWPNHGDGEIDWSTQT